MRLRRSNQGRRAIAVASALLLDPCRTSYHSDRTHSNAESEVTMYQRHRGIGITLLTAIGWFAISLSIPCEAAPIKLNTPGGLAKGDTFQFAFVTTTTTNGMGNLAFYNNFVNADAAGATYNGVAVQWYALVVATNSPTNPIFQDPLQLQENPSPVYQANDGGLVGTSLNRIVAGTFLGPGQPNPLILDLNGKDWTDSRAWTGIDSASGENVTGLNQLRTATPYYGTVGAAYPTWFFDKKAADDNLYHVYAFSELLTVPAVVPEPSTLLMMSLGTTFVAISFVIRRRRDRRGCC
jgi:hypothetical protein